jgi:hypothetical protein
MRIPSRQACLRLRLLATNQIDYRPAALMLYALQTASTNLRMTSFEPEPTQVVIDQECVERRPIGATAWSRIEGREYDELTDDELMNGDADTPVKSYAPPWCKSDRPELDLPEDERLLPGESQATR